MPVAPEHVAALRAAGLDPQRTERIGEGWFAVAYRSGDRVARVLQARTAAAGWVEGYEREVELLRMLERRGLPVPRAAEAIRAMDGRLLGAAHRYVDGVTTRDLRLGPRARARLAGVLGDFLTELHAVPLAEARALRIPELDLASELYAPLVEEALPLLRPRSSNWVRERLEEFTAGGGSARAARVLLHGDLGWPHILTDASGSLRGVIDFGDTMIGDPAFDFAGIGHSYSWGFLDLVRASYRGAAAHDPDLPRRAGFYIDVAPLYSTVYGNRLDDPQLLARGRRQLAARAAAATRAAR